MQSGVEHVKSVLNLQLDVVDFTWGRSADEAIPISVIGEQLWRCSSSILSKYGITRGEMKCAICPGAFLGLFSPKQNLKGMR